MWIKPIITRRNRQRKSQLTFLVEPLDETNIKYATFIMWQFAPRQNNTNNTVLNKTYVLLDKTYVLLDITPDTYYLLPDTTNVHLLLVATR